VKHLVDGACLAGEELLDFRQHQLVVRVHGTQSLGKPVVVVVVGRIQSMGTPNQLRDTGIIGSQPESAAH